MEENTQQHTSNHSTEGQGAINTPLNKEEDIKNNKIFAALSYIWLVSVFILLFKKESAFAKFHAKQGLILAIASIVFGFIPVLGWLLVLAVFIFEVIGFITALQGRYYKLPLVDKVAEKINL